MATVVRYLARRRTRRGIATIIGVILLVAITVVTAGIIYAIRIPQPSIPTQINYTLLGGSGQVYGGGDDCVTNSSTNTQTCLSMPAFTVVFTATSPAALALSSLQLVMLCNGTVYLSATLQAMEWIPGSPGVPSASAPQLGSCGTFVPPKGPFLLLGYFQQLTPGSQVLRPGDQLVVFMNPGGTCSSGFPPSTPPWNCDTDYHGIPSWCFQNPGNCPIVLRYTGGGGVSGTLTSFAYGPLFRG